MYVFIVSVQLPHKNSDSHPGYYRGVLNLFHQRGIVVEKEVGYARNPRNEQQFMCTITADLRNKRTIVGTSQYLPKKQAEEEAAANLFNRIKPCLPDLREGK